ncbi:hypothetical protein B0J12DRAFT_696191 [Macrophomina phaseolina]|uniref:Uncharacterized protein n=1 Tax=Macrophomina phaseolina TaxID=35725 RepID=A0ABQ8GN40_9PEZI|nr:hypothetical protein B0J12DRAFT_696191 [Macrophomina phaseolina]
MRLDGGRTARRADARGGLGLVRSYCGKMHSQLRPTVSCREEPSFVACAEEWTTSSFQKVRPVRYTRNDSGALGSAGGQREIDGLMYVEHRLGQARALRALEGVYTARSRPRAGSFETGTHHQRAAPTGGGVPVAANSTTAARALRSAAVVIWAEDFDATRGCAGWELRPAGPARFRRPRTSGAGGGFERSLPKGVRQALTRAEDPSPSPAVPFASALSRSCHHHIGPTCVAASQPCRPPRQCLTSCPSRVAAR